MDPQYKLALIFVAAGSALVLALLVTLARAFCLRRTFRRRVKQSFSLEEVTTHDRLTDFTRTMRFADVTAVQVHFTFRQAASRTGCINRLITGATW